MLTPLSRHDTCCAAGANPLVTAEKAHAPTILPSVGGSTRSASAAVICPDGTTVHLSADDGAPSHIILGRGKFGIPSSATHVSRKACVLRLVEKNDGEGCGGTSCSEKQQYALELIVLGSQPCRLTRSGSSEPIFVKSLSQLLENGTDLSPSTVTVFDGDVIEPYERPSDYTIDDAKAEGIYYPFRISIVVEKSGEAGDDIDGASSFLVASRKIDLAARLEKNIRSPAVVTVGTQTTLTYSSLDLNGIANSELESSDTGSSPEESRILEKIAVSNEGTENEPARSNDDADCATANGDEKSPIQAVGVEDAAKRQVSSRDYSSDENESANDDASDDESILELVPSAELAKWTNAFTAREEAIKVLNPTTGYNEQSKQPASPVRGDDQYESSGESSVEDIAAGEAYHEIKAIIGRVERPGTFAVGGSCDGKLLMPGLVVDGIGAIGLPLSKVQAEELARRCTQTTVGCESGNELAAEHFKITDPRWKDELNSLVDEACVGLGVDSCLRVETRIRKIVLNEESLSLNRGSHKSDGMFGTLIIVLPSQYSGGELVTKHNGETKTFDHGFGAGFGCQYAAFYDDCKHQLQRVSSGNRLCAVYDLVKVGYGCRPKSVNRRALVKGLKSAAQQWSDEFDDKKIILLMKCNSSQPGVSAKCNDDRNVVVELLKEAIEDGAELEIDHGTVRYESGSTQGDVSHGRKLLLTLSTHGDNDLTEEEAMQLGKDIDRRQQHDPVCDAIVIWPQSAHWKVVCNNDAPKMLKHLAKCCDECTGGSQKREECTKMARSMISRVKGNDEHRATLMRCIAKVGCAETGMKLLASYLSYADPMAPSVVEQLRTFIGYFGAEETTSTFLLIFTVARFNADPSAAANWLLKFRSALGSREDLIQTLVEAFVDVICPTQKIGKVPTSKSLDSFPLDSVLDMVSCGKYGNAEKLSRHLLDGYVRLSSQEPDEKPDKSSLVTKPGGPKLLPNVALSLVNLCQTFGWTNYKGPILRGATELCRRRPYDAVAFIEKIFTTKIPGKVRSDRDNVCCRLGSIVCELLLRQSPQFWCTRKNSSTLQAFRSLVKIIQAYQPLAGYDAGKNCRVASELRELSAKELNQRFVELAKTLDVDNVLYPLVTDGSLRSTASGSIKSSLGLLTFHCAEILKTRVSADLGMITVWCLPNASLSRNDAYASFLRDPCKHVLDWQARKSDHKKFMEDLKPLIHLQEIKVESYQPRGRGDWHMVITKLRPHSVSLSDLCSLSCTCSYGSECASRPRHLLANPSCRLARHKATLAKFTEDRKRLIVVKSLLTVEQRKELDKSPAPEPTTSRERPLPDASVPTSAAKEASTSRKRPSPDAPTTASAVPNPAAENDVVERQPSKKQKQSASCEVIDLT